MRETQERILKALLDGKEHRYTEIWKQTGRANKVTWTNLQTLVAQGFVRNTGLGTYQITEKGIQALTKAPPPGFRKLINAARMTRYYLYGFQPVDDTGRPLGDLVDVGLIYARIVSGAVSVCTFLDFISDVKDIDLGRDESTTANKLHEPLTPDNFFIDIDNLITTAAEFAELNKGDRYMEEVAEEVLRRAKEIKDDMMELTRRLNGKKWYIEPIQRFARYPEKESGQVIIKAKTALALKKVLIFIFDARYLCKNFPGKFDIKLSELEEHAEIIKRLLVERYDPTFDLVKEEADEEKYLRWRLSEHIPGFTQLSQWMYKNWFSKMENLVSLIETLPSSATRNELVQALLAVCKVMKGIGMDTNEIERRLISLQGSGP